MTREEAMQFFRDEILSLKMAPKLNGCDMTEDWTRLLVINALALEALREQEERNKRCEHCAKHEDPCGIPMIATEDDEPDRGIYLYNGTLCANGGTFCSADVQFCPMCGRKLEAYTMAMDALCDRSEET